jgi:thiosulfate reductase cytochrome b subunit
MKLWARILLIAGMVVMHYVFFFLPLAEMFIVYIILFNPRWFRRFLNNMSKAKEQNIETASEGSSEELSDPLTAVEGRG